MVFRRPSVPSSQNSCMATGAILIVLPASEGGSGTQPHEMNGPRLSPPTPRLSTTRQVVIVDAFLRQWMWRKLSGSVASTDQLNCVNEIIIIIIIIIMILNCIHTIWGKSSFYEECRLLGCGASWVYYEPYNIIIYPHGSISQKAAIFTVVAVKTSKAQNILFILHVRLKRFWNYEAVSYYVVCFVQENKYFQLMQSESCSRDHE